MKVRIEVVLEDNVGVRWFNDWYDFADWMKQKFETGKSITIRGWKYIPLKDCD